MDRTQRIAIIGAGPIGLEAALFAKLSGYEVAVYERGTVAENVRQWGHVRLFSPFGLNVSPWGRETLENHQHALPAEEDLLTGREFAKRYLLPLSQLPDLAGCIHSRTEVTAIGRARQLKADHIGLPARRQTPFQLLIATEQAEEVVETDSVLDCSGTYPNHNWLGAGGMPCPGERRFLTAADYQLPDILGAERGKFANRAVLVVGGGYSAATAIAALAKLSETAPETTAVWLTRTPRELPIPPMENDALPERERLTNEANRLAVSHPAIDWRRGWLVRSIFQAADQSLQVEIADAQGQQERIAVDHLLGQVGYRPDRSLYEELQIHECYATQGPMKLAAALLGETSADCLSQTSHGGETLKNPEPGFFILGAKSYGRNSRFLIQVGIAQIREAFSLIAQEQSLAER